MRGTGFIIRTKNLESLIIDVVKKCCYPGTSIGHRDRLFSDITDDLSLVQNASVAFLTHFAFGRGGGDDRIIARGYAAVECWQEQEDQRADRDQVGSENSVLAEAVQQFILSLGTATDPRSQASCSLPTKPERPSMLESLSEHFALFYYLLLCLVSLVGLLLVTIGIPGQFLPGIVALICWFFGFDPGEESQGSRGVEALILLGMAIFAEFIEFLSGLLGARSAGSSRRGAVGAIVGGLLGGILGNLLLPLIGGIFGILLGTGLGAYWGEKSALSRLAEEGLASGDRDDQAVKVGIASMIGRAIGLMAKISIAIACLLYSFFSFLAQLL